MSDYIRKLNDSGILGFAEYIKRIKAGDTSTPPENLLFDDRYSEPAQYSLVLEQRQFETRYDMGLYLANAFKDQDMQALMGDRGFWSWIALYYMGQLCPAMPSGKRKPSMEYNYILSGNYNHRPRHALLTTWRLVNEYGESSRFLLSKKPSERGELIEQLAARQYLISCRGVINTASKLYSDSSKLTFKKGSTSTKRKGNIRRFITFLQQLELTYDLFCISEEQLISMLPSEYETFLNS